MYNFKKKVKKKKKLLYKKRKQNSKKIKKDYKNKKLNAKATVTFSKNNIFFNVACRIIKKKKEIYSTIYWVSCGSEKFSKPKYTGSTKTTYVSNYAVGKKLAKYLKTIKLNKPINLIIKGSSKYFNTFLKAFKIFYKKKFGILDLTPISLNGCKIKKARRI